MMDLPKDAEQVSGSKTQELARGMHLGSPGGRRGPQEEEMGRFVGKLPSPWEHMLSWRSLWPQEVFRTAEPEVSLEPGMTPVCLLCFWHFVVWDGVGG
jgi:hypothetical protein